MVAPPGRFSTTTVWPQIFESCCDKALATASVPPPVVYGTTTRTDLFGKVCAMIKPHHMLKSITPNLISFTKILCYKSTLRTQRKFKK
jgi:hypothetical protein